MVELIDYYSLFTKITDLSFKHIFKILLDSLETLPSESSDEVFMLFYKHIEDNIEIIKERQEDFSYLRKKISQIIEIEEFGLIKRFTTQISFLCYWFKIEESEICMKKKEKEEVFPILEKNITSIRCFFTLLIKEKLLPVYLTTQNTNRRDCVAYVIQELLKEYPLLEYKNISQETKNILSVFTETEYRITGKFKTSITFPIVDKTKNVDEWRRIFLTHLTANTKCDILKNIQKCSLVYRDTPELVCFLLKHLLIHNILFYKGEAVVSELEYVQRKFIKEGEFREHNRDIIMIFDEILYFIVDKETTINKENRKEILIQCSRFLQPQISLRCGLYESTIRSIEFFIIFKNLKKEDKENFLRCGIEAFSYLESIEGVLGYEAELKKTFAGRILPDDIRALVAEREGRWADAECCYERILSQKNNKKICERLLKVQLEQGKHQTVMSLLNTEDLSQEIKEKLKIEAVLMMNSWDIPKIKREFFYDQNIESNFEKACSYFLKNKVLSSFSSLFQNLSGNVIRMKLIDNMKDCSIDHGTFEQKRIFLRSRIFFGVLSKNEEIEEKARLSLSVLLRKNKQNKLARDCLLRIQKDSNLRTIELSKIEWKEGNKSDAIDLISTLEDSKAKSLLARWKAESEFFKAEDVIGAFREAKSFNENNMKLSFNFAEYLS